ncbi:MAG TPA: hypothetical protein VFO34_04060 [Candidatus Acidoferrales bacterium]|nr:hypothetical protein [Candidatus Acidoferrales bacterium]
MKSKSRLCSFAIFALAVAFSASAAHAQTYATGKFTLEHQTQWNNVSLPAGNYTFQVEDTVTNAKVIRIRGDHQTTQVMMYPNRDASNRSEMTLEVRNGYRYVTSFELPGFAAGFRVQKTAAEKESVASNSQSEHISVQTAAH